ncbi:MAG: hypothetical protein HYX86_04480 [Chloroflexi bacterium]|nr:hypothetical protein [Chloroflexota bacterium]
MRAALTDTPVPAAQFPDGWDGTGLFKRGEIEDYLVTGPAVPSWNFKCDPNPLVLEHGETKAIALVIESDDPLLAWPNDGHIAGVSGDPDPAGTNWDPDADEVTGKIVWDANGNPSVEVGSIEDPPTRTVYYTFRPVLTQRAADGTIVQEHQRECQVVVKHTEPEPTPTPTPSKFILADISVTHTIREGYVHFTVHVRNQAYDGQIYGKEIFFDGVLVERFMYDFWILPHCQPSEVDIDYQGNPPKVIEFHFLRRDGSNLGSVFSQQVTTGMGKSVPGAGIPSPRPICV